MSHSNQFSLLGQRRYGPLFLTQFCGAANDNIFKFAFTVLVTYQLQVAWLPTQLAGLVIAGLFILPMVLVSATAGQLTDKYNKTTIIRWVKNLEIAIMLLAGWGFLAEQVAVLLGCVFLMGLHSTLFGPVKYAYLPQVLSEAELTGGNGMVEMGTFIAILLGQLTGGLLIAIPGVGREYVAGACLLVAIVGRLAAQAVPVVAPADPQLRMNWNPLTETWRNVQMARQWPQVFRTLLGISWMWFFGAVFLSLFPSLAKDVLHGNEQVASLLLVVFSVGVGTGSVLCEVLCPRRLELGLVPAGALGMTLFSVDLYFAMRGLPASDLMGVAAFLSYGPHWRVLADLFLLSLFAGVFSVPMYALIQLRCPETHRARVIACNNILNALFMIVSSLVAGVLLSVGFTIPEVLLGVGVLNVVAAVLLFRAVPEYWSRFVTLAGGKA
ncbi:MFS transporter [Curvibacter sp. CHRR-16]|nr:MFS transporter [Curvibacter sp. CHRR-16]